MLFFGRLDAVAVTVELHVEVSVAGLLAVFRDVLDCVTLSVDRNLVMIAVSVVEVDDPATVGLHSVDTVRRAFWKCVLFRHPVLPFWKAALLRGTWDGGRIEAADTVA